MDSGEYKMLNTKRCRTTRIPAAGLVPEPEPVPGPSSQQTTDMDTCERDRGHKRNKDNTDIEPEERKQLKIKPKRIREQLKEQVEKKPRKEEAVIEETERSNRIRCPTPAKDPAAVLTFRHN